MKYINRVRGTGKSAILIATSYTTGIPIIALTEERKKILLEEAEFMKCDVQVFTVNEFKEHRYIGKEVYNSIMIDESKEIIGLALDDYFGCNVVAATMTLPVEGE